jgi:hypothetical protein
MIAGLTENEAIDWHQQRIAFEPDSQVWIELRISCRGSRCC